MPVLNEYYTPTPVAPPPPTQEPVYQEPAPAPVEQAPPPQSLDSVFQQQDPAPQQAPPPQGGSVVLSPGSGQAPAQPAAPPPQDTGRIVLSPGAGQPTPAATPAPSPTSAVPDAIGTAAAGVRDDPGGTIIRAAKGLPENLQEFTGAGRDKDTSFRPGNPEVDGVRYDGSQIDTYNDALGAAASRVAGGDLGAIKDVAGGVLGVGAAHLSEHAGDPTPERVNQVNWIVERARDEKASGGDAFASKPDADPVERTLWGAWYGNNDFTNAYRTDPNLERAYNEGYTTPDGEVIAPGAMASWQYFQDQQSGLARGLNDMTVAPGAAILDAAATALTGGGEKLATEAAESAARTGVKQVGKATTGKVMTGAGRAIDAVGTLGLSEAVPAALKVTRAGYNALPWAGKQTAGALDQQAVSDLGEAATSVLSEVQAARAAGVPGVPTAAAPSYVTTPTPDKSIMRVALPAEGANPPVDIAYKLGPDGTAKGVYDVVVPGPTDRYRMPTVAESEQLLTLWQRLPNADRQKVRQAWFPTLSRMETSPGEPFIEHAAEKVYDRAGRLIADTGRVGEGYERWKADLRSSMLADGHPNNIIQDFTGSWEKTLTDGMLHPLTRRSMAEHRLQSLKDVMGGLPASFNTPEVQRRIRDMEAMLPKDVPAIGTGLTWRKGAGAGAPGSLAPVTAREASWLKEKAAEPPKSFRKTGLVKGGDLVFDRVPDPVRGTAGQRNGYANYLDIMSHRVTNPPTSREELGNIKDAINGMRTAAPTPAISAREAALKDVLERNAIIPGATGMSTDAVSIAIEDYLRRTRPTFPALPGAASGPPAGVFTPGSQDELWGMSLLDKVRDQLDITLEIDGTQRSAGQRLRTHWEETAYAQEAAKRQERGITNPADEKLLGKQLATINTQFPIYKNKKLTATQLAAFTPEQIDRTAATLLKHDMEISKGLRNATSGKLLTPAETKGLIGKGFAVYDQFISLWRSTVLYNIGRGVVYPMMQAVGNLATVGITMASNAEKGGRGYLGMYMNPKEWKRTYDFLRDPEISPPPRAIEMRRRMGLGDSDIFGRTSRDQLGPTTAYNGPDAHWLSKAAGTVLGNQKIKDIADTFDLRLAYAAYTSMLEPAYARLKKDLPAMADMRFQRMAGSRGIPVPVSRDQINMAIATLSRDTDGVFTQTQLRQALFEAAGGSTAPNRDALMDMAERIARDYKEEASKLDLYAQAEARRIAFIGTGETNLNAAMQRALMFTWWVSNASQLYLTEAAKSPVQMLMWSRALDAADYNERTGTDPRYKWYREFAATPAGFTLSLNPMGLLGGYLFGTTTDPSDPRQIMTKLGEIQSGGWIGDNLILSPGIQLALTATGALGRDARMPDIFGTNRLEQEIVNTLNLVNHHLIQFASTPGGGKAKIDYPGVSQGMINWVAQQISGKINGTQQVAGFDPNASSESQIGYIVADLIQQENPDLDPNDPGDADTLERGVNLAMQDHDSPAYQKALGLWVDGQYESGLGAGQGNAALDIIGGIARRYVSPLPISAQPTYRAERNERVGRDKLRKAGSETLDPTGEASELDLRMGGTASKSPEGRDLALIKDEAAGDPQTQAVRDISSAIEYDKATDMTAAFAEAGITTIRIQGYDFTPEQIASLPPEDRKTLKNAWINDTGARPLMDAYYENRDKQLRADKAFADAEGLSKYAQQYPGGVDRFVDDTANVNPNYEKFINGYAYIGGGQAYLPELRTTNHDLWAQAVTQFDQARSVIAGVKDSRYGIDVDPKYAGLVSGSDVPVGTWLVQENEANAAGDSEFIATMRADYDTINGLGQALDTLDTQWGQAVGTNRSIMAQRLINGEKYPLDLDMKAAVEGLGVNDTALDNPRAAGEYLAWSVAQPAGADTSIDAYNQTWQAEQNRTAVPLIAERLATGQVPPLDAQGNPVATAPYDATSGLTLVNGAVGVGTRPGMSTIAAPVVLGSQPGSNDGYQVPAGMPVQTGQRMNGSDGSVWVFVTSGGGVSGWVNMAALAPAA